MGDRKRGPNASFTQDEALQGSQGGVSNHFEAPP
jgi:hypothetical protein